MLVSRHRHADDRARSTSSSTPASSWSTGVVGDLVANESQLLGMLDDEQDRPLRTLRKLLSRFE